MATATFYEDSSHGASRGPLSVSKASHRIGKKSGGGGPSSSGSRSPPTVYKIEPEGFRSLVQQLTGPSLPKSSGNRLQNLAPPPLAPPTASRSQVGLSNLNSSALAAAFKPSFFSPGFDFTSGSGPAFSPKFAFSPLSFSPLAELTPRDSVWANGLESPGTADIKTLAQLVAGEDPFPQSSKALERAAHGSFTFGGKVSGCSTSSFELGSEFNFPNL